MYCPKCGGSVWDKLFGGACTYKCVYCDHGINCTRVLSNEIDTDSLPIASPEKAMELRQDYDKIEGNKEKGQKNLQKNQAFYDKAKKDTCQINEGMLRVRKAIKESLKSKSEELSARRKKYKLLIRPF